MYAPAVASDDTTSDETDESSLDDSDESRSESSSDESSADDSLDFGAGKSTDSEAESDDDTSEEESAEDEDASSEPESEPEDESEPKDESEPSEDKSSEEDSEDKETPKEEIPPLTKRATLYGAWGCVGLLLVVLLVFFVLIRSAIYKIDDYGAVASVEESGEEPAGEQPPEEPTEPETPRVERTLEWASSYPEARAAARIDLRPILLVFTAEYATESIDVFEGVFATPDVESFLERYYQVVHIDMGAQGDDPDPSIALCEVEFLPHVCYLHPETEEKLNEDTTGMIGTNALLREIVTARAAYEASADAE